MQADEDLICTDPEGTGDSTFIQPVGVTACDNGQVFLTLGDRNGGIEGQEMREIEPGSALDRTTCTTTEPSALE
jgi:hypothetical protein